MVKRNEFVEGKAFIIPSVYVEWCHLVQPDTEFQKSQWSVDMRLEEPMAKSLKEAGFNVRHTKDKKKFKEGDELYYFLKSYSKTATAKGPNKMPPTVDANAKPMDGNLVGNGSKCNIKVWAKYVDVNGETHLPAYLNGVQVIELVEYTQDGFDPVDASDPSPTDDDFLGGQTSGAAF